MEKINVKDMRKAIAYVQNQKRRNPSVQDIADEDLLKSDFSKDLHMGNIRIANVVIELQRIHNLDLPLEVFKNAHDGTVGGLMNSINDYISKN